MFVRAAVQRAFYTIVALLVSGTATHAQGPMSQATDEHKALAREAGVWDAEMKLWMAPDSEPLVSKGKETNEMLGSMWVVSKFEGDVAGMPFEGRGQYGYDPVKKKFIGTWVDTMSPFLSTMEGTTDADGTLTMMSTGRDMETGEMKTTKMISKYVDKDHRTFEIHDLVPGKKDEWWKMMEVSYTRR